VEQDLDSETRAAGQALLAGGDSAVLADHFDGHLGFGTAGMRGALGPGPRRMNRSVVQRVGAGLAAYTLSTVPDASTRGAVVGYDARHGSRVFAEDTARVLAAAGIPVWLSETTCPTPSLAHALTHLGAAVGVMVTASHNPRGDNGYKVYWGNGAQIVPPHDLGIGAAIDWANPLPALPPLDGLVAAGEVRAIPPAAWEDYLARVLALRVHTGAEIRAVYTALHGVGGDTVLQVLSAAGHFDVHTVDAQQAPDGDFPTVDFPNPEEPGALDLALADAAALDADLVIANDPDADRLAVALPGPDGAWSMLTGDEVGVLLADDLLRHGPQGPERMVATTIVSSTMLHRIAQAHGARSAETLTGFKWIATRAIAHDGPFLIGYEEALGYSIGDVVRDKDGISAALLLLDLAAWAKARGETLHDRLALLYRQHGLHRTRQRSIRMTGDAGAARIASLTRELRAMPPAAIAGSEVVRIRDVLAGTDTDLRTGRVGPVALPESDVLALHLADGSRVLVRPSGTEPKIKLYFEVVLPLDEGQSLAAVQAQADARIDALDADLRSHMGMDA
jgi:phosphomannomutase